jgi:hypothetical protein
VIAIGLALTLLVAYFLLPWAWNQISDLLPVTATRSIGPAPAPLPVKFLPPLSLGPAMMQPAA